jgi:hypothetical protein
LERPYRTGVEIFSLTKIHKRRYDKDKYVVVAIVACHELISHNGVLLPFQGAKATGFIGSLGQDGNITALLPFLFFLTAPWPLLGAATSGGVRLL